MFDNDKQVTRKDCKKSKRSSSGYCFFFVSVTFSVAAQCSPTLGAGRTRGVLSTWFQSLSSGGASELDALKKFCCSQLLKELVHTHFFPAQSCARSGILLRKR